MKRIIPITKEMLLTSSPEIAYKHAHLGKGPFKAGEAIIATDAKYSFWYAKYVLKGRFIAGEAVINAHPIIAKRYKEDVLDRDWIGEEQEREMLFRIFGLGGYHKS